MSTADDLLARALQAFARNGYVRSSVQGIAREARVSTRTIYNLYGSKAGLCEAVLGFSTRRMVGHHIRPIHACLSEPDIHECLVQFATNWVGCGPWSEGHQALVRHVQAKRPQLPQSAIDAWVTLGPLGIRVLLENELRRFFARSQSQSPPTDLAAAATHLMLLFDGGLISRGFYRAEPLDQEYVACMARHGAEVFMKVYQENQAA